jgi:DNA-binding NtrC family response regulator
VLSRVGTREDSRLGYRLNSPLDANMTGRDHAGPGTSLTMTEADSQTNTTRLRVLVVEDETLIRWAVAEALTAAGHDVVEAADAATARRLIDESADPLDAVLLDLRLPDSSDLSLLAAIRRAAPATAVVMMTAHGTREEAATAKALGAYDVLEKPFDVHEIEHILVAACQARPLAG